MYRICNKNNVNITKILETCIKYVTEIISILQKYWKRIYNMQKNISFTKIMETYIKYVTKIKPLKYNSTIEAICYALDLYGNPHFDSSI